MKLLSNEEDVKIKIVVPFLQNLGFDVSEMYYEQNFTFHMGHFTQRVETEKQVNTAQSRLDILVKRNGQNLFIIEVKGPNIIIDSNDIDQAVSYARLVHPVAPLCLVTNGQDWKLVDTITKEELSQDKVDPNMNFNVALHEEAYYQAIKYFLGYSRENILAFCQWQVNHYMEQLRGSVDDTNKKYIPELYEERSQLADFTRKFIDSNAPCFIAISDSGSGKTCWACHTALQYLNQGFATFFYRGSDVTTGIFKAISNDLNWMLSPQHNEVQAIRRLLDLFQNEQILIWVDDIDGIPVSTATNIIKEFLIRTEGYSIKLLLTCKSETWKNLFEENDETPTLLATRISRNTQEKGYRVEAFDDEKMLSMITKYRSFYKFNGRLDLDVLETCKRTPFLLRILFEVASYLSLNTLGFTVVADFYEAYFEKLCARFGKQRDKIQRLLPAIANYLYEQNKDEVELDDLLKILNIPILQSLPEQLFELNILERSYREQTTYVGFYFKKLRDYLIAFRALKWQKKSEQDFRQICSLLNRQGIHLDVLNLYYSLTPLEEHKRVLDSLLYENASEFLTLYEEILNTHFPNVKQSFPPLTPATIGFVGYLDLSRTIISGHGFRPLRDKDTKVLLLPTAPKIWHKDNKGFLFGSLRMHSTSSSRGFRELDIEKEVIQQNIQPSLDKIIEQGQLDESQNEALLVERLIVTCLQNYPDYFQSLRDNISGTLFPLSLERVKVFLLYKIAYDLLWHQLFDHYVATGKVEEKRNGLNVGYNFHIDPKDQAELERKAWAIAREGNNVSVERNYRKVEDRELFLLNDIKCLEQLGISEISRSRLTDWYEEGKRQKWAIAHDDNYHDARRQLLEDILLTFLKEYRILVERNFPTLCKYFELYQKMPVKLFFAIGEADQKLGFFDRSLYLQEHKGNQMFENQILYYNMQELKHIEQNQIGNPAYYDSVYIECYLDDVLFSRENHIPLQDSNGNGYVLRQAIYKRVKKEITEVCPLLVSQYQGLKYHIDS